MKPRLIITVFLLNAILSFAQESISLNGENAYIKSTLTPNSQKFTFAILADKTNGGELNWPIFDRAVDEINLLQPDFVIMVGDMIQGVTTDTSLIKEMWKEFKSHADKLTVPLYLLPGNHDISNEVMYDYWNKNIGLRYYSFKKNNSLFILLNTEEYRKTKDGELGKKQIDFVMNELEKNKEVDQTFIFFHRPLWVKGSAKHGGYNEWLRINSKIKNRNTTLFAGHRHRLIFNKSDGHKQIVLSATGGSLNEKILPQLGYFHHYTIVTVDGDSSNTAIIKPGNIFHEDIANNEFTKKFDRILKNINEINIKGKDVILNSKISMSNLLNKKIEYIFRINNKNSSWDFNKSVITGSLEPNESVSHELLSKNIIINSIPLPTIEYEIMIDGKKSFNKTLSFVPSENKIWQYPNEVMLLGGIDLGVSQKPKTSKSNQNTFLDKKNNWASEQQIISSKISDGFEWQDIIVENGVINITDKVDQTDFAFGYIKFIIESDKAQVVLASLRPDNYGQVYLNDKIVLEGSPFKGVPINPYIFKLNIKKGENILLIKTANFYGTWYADLKISNPQNTLLFKTDKERNSK
ncbi:MAG: hypothetical protein GY936_21050 [Ignavibacteriae bacterium]|nr:hypothetical protein [Ignavibacteriota bacterium]